MMRCCMIWYAHFKAAEVGDSSPGFFGSDDGRGVSIGLLTSIAKRTASLTERKLCYPVRISGGFGGAEYSSSGSQY